MGLYVGIFCSFVNKIISAYILNLSLQVTDSSVSQRNSANHLLITVILTAITAIQIIPYFVTNTQCAYQHVKIKSQVCKQFPWHQLFLPFQNKHIINTASS